MSVLKDSKKNHIIHKKRSDFGRKVQVIIDRLRIGHTNLTHGHLMCNKESPVCEKCGVSSTYFN